MDTSLFDYVLPADRIAQTPAEQRDLSRLMIVCRKTRTIQHAIFGDIVDLLPANTAVFRNNATVFKARLRGTRPGGGGVECLMIKPGTHPSQFWCLLKPGRKLPCGSAFKVGDTCGATVIDKDECGQFLVQFSDPHGPTALQIAETHGNVPLPPYIQRGANSPAGQAATDAERYQTVYADPQRQVAAAAPTAGLHFTAEVISRLLLGGTEFHDLTLHVGLDTFRPIQTDQVEAHPIHREFYEIPADTLEACEHPGLRRRLAVGTTTLRALEDSARKRAGAGDAAKAGSPYSAEADIFIFPPAMFQRVDALLTNFHLPRSTLLCLVSAFLCPGSSDGIVWLKELYAEAIAREYRFFSYGDAMLIL